MLLSLLNIIYTTVALATGFHTAKILDLRPTQFAVGEREVGEKVASLQDKDAAALDKYLEKHPAPVVVGPGGLRYLTDHHHLARALWKLGRTEMFVTVEADLSALDTLEFWRRMRAANWVYLQDETGEPREPSQLPRDVRGLADDRYRSLAGAARDAGAFAKTEIPFAEFRWADFFRARIKIASGESAFHAALKVALKLSHSPEAKSLPGYFPASAN